ncbi:MAG TPA: antibiotic biosynthesis monooxygenase [Ktedonobacterales bacterium]|jgi:hypothetical protein
MAIEMRQALPGFSAEQAAAVAAVVNERARTAPGFIAHASGPIPGGYHVTEIWESREAFERFSDEVVVPLMRRIGADLGSVSPPLYLPLDNVVTR